MRLVWAPRAAKDLNRILTYIHKRSPSGARNVALDIDRAVSTCASRPFSGAKTKTPQVFRHPMRGRRITIFYRVVIDRGVVQIVRIVRSGRVKSLRRVPD